jgi:hypothetical protein
MLLTELDLCVNHSTRSMNEVIVMHKKDALGVELSPLNAMEKPHYTNSDFGVCDVNGHSFGKHEITELHVISTGSGCGLPRVSPSDYYAECRATVPLNLTESKITGLNEIRRRQVDYSNVRYVIFDATYFHKDGCLLNIMNAIDQNIIAQLYVNKESFKDAYVWFANLKYQGLNPMFVTTDGERSIIRAMKLVWPGAKLQRCLYHIQHEGMRWLRTYPKTEAGKELRAILSNLSRIKTYKERDAFIHKYHAWVNKYKYFVLPLPRATISFKDLRRTMVLINNALSDMFYFLDDENVHSTTNALESFHSRLKSDYQRHRGLTREHKIGYIQWYRYFKNGAN